MKSRSLKRWTDADLHWLAGLLDGSGTIAAARRPSVGVRLRFVSRNAQVIGRAADLLAVRPVEARSVFSATAEGDRACRALIRLRPHVSDPRKAEIDAALESR